jgi:hypothetical protein
VLTEAVGRRWCKAAKGETRWWHGRRVAAGGLRVEEYQWTTGKLSEVAAWPEEDGGWLMMVNSMR